MDLQVGAVGVDITITLRNQSGALIDLSTSTSRYIYLTQPNGRGTTRYTATLVSDGTTGQMKYTTASSTDLPVAGDWTIQARYVNPLGDYPSKRGMFVVLPNSF